jgi:hypothetical protein
MEVSKRLLDLTNKFLEEFLEACTAEDEGTKRDDLYHFNFTLADAIAQSNYPRYEEVGTILMGMSRFDDSIAKAFFNNNIQGFVKSIENRIAHTKGQEDYIVDGIKTEDYLADDFHVECFKTETGENSFKSIPCKTKAQKISFNVSNHKSGFEGDAVLYKKMSKEFTSNDKFSEKMVVKRVEFFCKGNKIMEINYHFDYDKFTYYETGTFTHYKHIADINSFFFVLGGM